MGQTIYRYKVLRAVGTVAYQCATTHLSEDEVLKEICAMFHPKERLKVYCNGKLVCDIGYYKAKKYDRIKNKQTGDIYPDLKAFCKELNISEAFAYHIIKHKNIYEWMKS